jgi:arginyl-tRNA synthetase
VITGDLDAALGPEAASAGTWRPPPTPSPPGTYATTAAFGLARARATDPAGLAAGLAARLTNLDWVAATSVTGSGYLTVTVSQAALATLAVRITQAGPACARTTILAGSQVTAPRHPALVSAPTWEEARRRLTESLTARIAEAAGARVAWTDDDAKRPPPNPPAQPHRGPLASALEFAGTDAITYALARFPPNAPARVDPALAAAHWLGNPSYAVRYAHARAASTLRQAADLGLGLGDAAGFQPWRLAHPGELSLLYELSWLPERVGGAARRGQPDVLARYLERLAGTYLGCQEQHPAVWPGMPAAAPESVPRLWLAAATATALAAGLGLLGVTAPDRL